MRAVRSLAVGMLIVVVLSGFVSTVMAQGTASLAGVVLDDLNGIPLSGALVSIPRLSLQTATDANGQFLIDGVPAGGHEVKFESHGYVALVERVTLTGTDFLQIRLDPMAAVLDQILVIAGRTPTGAPVVARDTRMPEGQRPVVSALDLLETQIPGVVVRRGGGLANGAAIIIRGVNSFRSDGAPVIVVDGLRLESTQTGQNSFHVLDMIPAESVARVRVIKSAAEASQYGNAANGVILIETVRGNEQN